MRVRSRLRNRLVRLAFRALFRTKHGFPVIRLGTSYGGWWVSTDVIGAGSVCYLAGVGTDISFDLELVNHFDCRAWGIDPTPKVIGWINRQSLDERYTFIPIGLAGDCGISRFYVPKDPDTVSHSIKNLQRTESYFTAEVLTVRALMNRLGHASIDLLKLDIEGVEHDTIRQMLADDVHPRIVCVEFDQPEPFSWAWQTVAALKSAGYVLAKIDGFNFTFVLKALVDTRDRTKARGAPASSQGYEPR